MTDRNNDSSTEPPELKQWQTPSVTVLDVKETEGGTVSTFFEDQTGVGGIRGSASRSS